MQIGKKDEVIPAVIYKTDDMTVLKAVLEPALDFHNCSNSVPSYAVSSTLPLMNALQHTVLLVHMLFLLVIALRRKCVCFTSLRLLSCWGNCSSYVFTPARSAVMFSAANGDPGKDGKSTPLLSTLCYVRNLIFIMVFTHPSKTVC